MNKKTIAIILSAAMIAACPVVSVGADQTEDAAAASDSASSVTAFDDVTDSGKYYYKPVYWARANGITGGISATQFGPAATCTRGQIVTFLYKMKGSPTDGASNPFTDVKAGSYYEKAALWAADQKITSGTTPTTFSPNAPCTRAQIVTFLWNLAGKPQVTGGAVFDDVSEKAYYAKAVAWASSKNIVSGLGNGMFGSKESCTRAQTVTMLYKYVSDGRDIAVVTPTPSADPTTAPTNAKLDMAAKEATSKITSDGKVHCYHGYTVINHLGYDVKNTKILVQVFKNGTVIKEETHTIDFLKNGKSFTKDLEYVSADTTAGFSFSYEITEIGDKVE
ncbi:MAG: S-layer homology domain-containing protein [Lachnospiraceae bacterium]|nr:S-layer homology domain-containing protein [Lachnospiraceae bacterium]